MARDLSKGYTCTCGKFNRYSAYVYAHWTVELVHTCDCGKRWSILEGEAEELEEWKHEYLRSQDMIGNDDEI